MFEDKRDFADVVLNLKLTLLLRFLWGRYWTRSEVSKSKVGEVAGEPRVERGGA